ncbi:Rieske 2Fe-2S domain-containing protein [Streptomyces broussonetiae]
MNTEQGLRGSYWIETSAGGEPAAPPSGSLTVDVAVIGGGMAGRSTGPSGGIMAGVLIADLVESRQVVSVLYDPRRLNSKAREGVSFLKHQARVAKHFLGDRLPPVTAPSPKDLTPGDGAVLRVGRHQCAVHRDGSGQLRAVSARCTHLGCLVAFNRAEQACVCPCHGSRFAPDGRILQGPVRPLEKREV